MYQPVEPAACLSYILFPPSQPRAKRLQEQQQYLSSPTKPKPSQAKPKASACAKPSTGGEVGDQITRRRRRRQKCSPSLPPPGFQYRDHSQKKKRKKEYVHGRSRRLSVDNNAPSPPLHHRRRHAKETKPRRPACCLPLAATGRARNRVLSCPA